MPALRPQTSRCCSPLTLLPARSAPCRTRQSTCSTPCRARYLTQSTLSGAMYTICGLTRCFIGGDIAIYHLAVDNRTLRITRQGAAFLVHRLVVTRDAAGKSPLALHRCLATGCRV